MTDPQQLRPATSDEIGEALAFALRYEDRKRVYDADLAMGRTTADRLISHLEAVGVPADEDSPEASADDRAHATIREVTIASCSALASRRNRLCAF